MEQDHKSTEGWLFMYGNTPETRKAVCHSDIFQNGWIRYLEAWKEAMLLVQLACPMGFRTARPVVIWFDSDSAVEIIRGGNRYRKSTKALNVRLNNLRDAV